MPELQKTAIAHDYELRLDLLEGSKPERSSAWTLPVAVLILLLIAKLLCFFPQAAKTGFYLDDWTKFANLHFSDGTFKALFTAGITDPTEVSRPVQPLYYAILYKIFGDIPTGYHIFSYIVDAFCGWFLFLALGRICANQSLAICAALLFVLCPLRDATNYWVGANLILFSLMLFTLSFWLLIRSMQEKRPIDFLASCVSFALSAFCYEAFLPLLGTLFCAAFLIMRREESNKTGLSFWRAFLVIAPHTLIALSLVFYQRYWVSKVAKVFLPPVAPGDISHFAEVMRNGFSVTIGSESWQFVFARAGEFLSESSFSGLLRASLLVVFVLLSIPLISKTYEQSKNANASRSGTGKILPSASLLLGLGLATIIFSYTVFGFASDYLPGLSSLLSRTNTGASLGLAILLAGIIGILSHYLGNSAVKLSFISIDHARLNITPLLVGLLTVPLLSLWFFANQGLAKPWALSWQVQTAIAETLSKESAILGEHDSLLLANCPRYVMWAPLFDGVWDFQPMVHMVTGKRNLSAGVVSERLELEGDILRDVSSGYECARYDTRGLNLLFLTDGITRISGARDFVDTIESRAMTFGLDPSKVASWRSSLEKE